MCFYVLFVCLPVCLFAYCVPSYFLIVLCFLPLLLFVLYFFMIFFLRDGKKEKGIF